MDYLDTMQFETYVSACAANAQVQVRWDKVDSTPRTDGKCIWIPRVHSHTSNEWLTRIRYYVKHETSHIVHSDFELLEKERPKGLLAFINNLLEDHRIDYLNDSEYAGDVVTSNKYWTIYGSDVVRNLESTDSGLNEQQRLTLPLFVWDASLREDWIDTASEVFHTLLKAMNDDNREVYNKLLGYSKELVSIRERGTPQDVMDLSRKILRDVFGEDPAKYIEQPDDTSSAKAEGDGEGEDEGKGVGKGGEDGEGDGGEPKRKEGEDIITVDKLMDTMMHKHESSRVGIHVPHDDVKSGAYVVPKTSEYIVLSFPEGKEHPDVRSYISSGSLNKATVNNYVTNNAKPLANKLRIRLQVRSRDKYEYGLKKGKLHNGSLHRLLTGDTNNSQRIFRQRKTNDTLDTAITLLVDCSGSMSGKKFDMACAGAAAMAAALRPLNIPFSMLGFTNTFERDKPMLWVFNDFGERVSDNEFVSRFSIASGALWENTDGDALAYAGMKLLQRKEKRKVLLVLSDGSPAGRRHAGDIRSYTKEVIDKLDKLIDIHAIGIMDDNVTRYYKSHSVVNSESELTPAILNVLERKL